MPYTKITKNQKLETFLSFFDKDLSKPQQKSVYNMVDGIICCESERTVSGISRNMLTPKNNFTVTDFLKSDNMNMKIKHLEKEKLNWAIALINHQSKKTGQPIIVSIDDFAVSKPKSSTNIEVLGFYKDTKDGNYSNQVKTVTLRVFCNNVSFTLSFRIYLRKKDVAKWNYHRKKQGKSLLRFRSKFSLAKDMLSQILPSLYKKHKIYVCFDSWYSSSKLIKFCRKLGAEVVCCIKSNRNISNIQIRKRSKLIKRFKANACKIKIQSKYGTRVYYTHSIIGFLKSVNKKVNTIISRLYKKNKFTTRFFISTDTSLTIKQILSIYNRRWDCEVDYLYLKCFLGITDFQLRNYEGIKSFFFFEILSLNYLQWRLYKTNRKKTLLDMMRSHKEERKKLFITFLFECFNKGLSEKEVLKVISC